MVRSSSSEIAFGFRSFGERLSETTFISEFSAYILSENVFVSETVVSVDFENQFVSESFASKSPLLHTLR